MNLLFGAVAHNQHAQQIAKALHEADVLGRYQSLGVDHYSRSWARRLRRQLGRAVPSLDRLLKPRHISAIPDHLVYADWTWDLPRTVAANLNLARIEDWLWERSEWKLDRDLAEIIRRSEYDAFFGIEHSALAALKTAKDMGKPGILGYMGGHHSKLEKWVYREYEQFPELKTPARKAILGRRRSRRYQRKDREADLADFIHTNSEFTKQSLVEAGVEEGKIHSVPLGCPPVRDEAMQSNERGGNQKIIFAGNASIQKGFHYLIDAWRNVDPGGRAELHCYGAVTVPDAVLRDLPSSVILHGRVEQERLFDAFLEGSSLVLPTLLDGFGMVVSEAFAHGLPVITTPNAGAADLVREGENGFLVPPRDSEALAEQLDWVLRHPDEVHSMRAAARRTAASWSWADFRETLRAQLDEAFGWSLSEYAEPSNQS